MQKIDDLTLIQAKNQYKKETTGSISEGMIVEEELISFSEYHFFDESIKIQIPDMLVDMPLEYAKMKYPMENRPPIIKTNENTDVNVTLNIIQQKVEHESIKNFTTKMMKVIKKMQPATVFYDIKYIDFEGNCKDNVYDIKEHETDRVEISFFDFRSAVIDDILYNLNAFVFLDDKVIYVCCNCVYSENEKWKNIFLEVIKSIRRD